MSVAKSYVNYPIVDGPYEKNKRLYVHIKYSCCKKKTCSRCGGSGSYLKEVRWYQEKVSFSDFNGRNAFGFGEKGYITLLKGPQWVLKDFFTNIAPRKARYNLLFFWYIPSHLPIPDNLPDEIELVRLNWEEVSENGKINDYKDIEKLVASLIGTKSL